MSFFIVNFILVALSAFFYSKAKNISAIIIFKYLTFLLLFLPPALQYRVGTDYPTYISFYKLIGKGEMPTNEMGYIYLNKILNSLDFNVQWFFVIMSFLTVLILFVGTPRKSFFLVAVLYSMHIYLPSFNIIRQVLAALLAYYAFDFFNKKKYKTSLVWIIFAFSFHFSALVYFILFVIMLLCNISKKIAIIGFIFIITFGSYSNAFIILLYNAIIPHTQYSIYINDVLLNATVQRNTGFGILLSYMIIFLFIITAPNIKNKVSSNMYILALCLLFFNVLGASNLIFSRMIYGFSFIWLKIASYITVTKYRYKKIIIIILYCWVFISSIVTMNHGAFQEQWVYRSIFNKQ